jgi:hypothetical protein
MNSPLDFSVELGFQDEERFENSNETSAVASSCREPAAIEQQRELRGRRVGLPSETPFELGNHMPSD